MFRIALSLIALRVIDDNFLQPAPGTSAADHLVSGSVLVGLLALAAYAHHRLRGGRGQAVVMLATGLLGLMVGADGLYYTRELGLSADDVTGLLALPAGVALLAMGATELYRARSRDGHRAWRYGRRGLLAGVLVVAAPVTLVPLTVGYVETKVARADVPANRLGVAYEDVKLRTRDGLELEGWYVPSRNGAAVIAFPGRKGPQRQARMLARHGYGVLLFDRRGEGRSDGEPNGWGWGGDEDVKAAVRYLQARPDVDPARIGGIGLSVGGELMLEAAAETPDLRAVVSEGAGARSIREELEGVSGLEKAFTAVGYAIRDTTVALGSNHTPPPHLKDLVGRIAPRPLLLIAAPNSPNGEKLNRLYFEHAREPKALWELPESRHIGGIEARPAEYERRVVGFFDRAL